MQNSSLIRLVELEKKSIAKFVFGYIFYDFVEALRFVGRQENPHSYSQNNLICIMAFPNNTISVKTVSVMWFKSRSKRTYLVAIVGRKALCPSLSTQSLNALSNISVSPPQSMSL